MEYGWGLCKEAFAASLHGGSKADQRRMKGLGFSDVRLEKAMLHFVAFSGGALAESLLALLQYKREQPPKA